MPDRGSSATLCVVCGERVAHSHIAAVVGRKPNGVPRLLCDRRSCRKAWADPERRAAMQARWVENRGK